MASFGPLDRKENSPGTETGALGCRSYFPKAESSRWTSLTPISQLSRMIGVFAAT